MTGLDAAPSPQAEPATTVDNDGFCRCTNPPHFPHHDRSGPQSTEETGQ